MEFPSDIFALFFRYLESPGVLTLLNRELREFLWVQFLRSLGIRRLATLAIRDGRTDILDTIPQEYIVENGPEYTEERSTLPSCKTENIQMSGGLTDNPEILNSQIKPERVLEIMKPKDMYRGGFYYVADMIRLCIRYGRYDIIDLLVERYPDLESSVSVCCRDHRGLGTPESLFLLETSRKYRIRLGKGQPSRWTFMCITPGTSGDSWRVTLHSWLMNNERLLDEEPLLKTHHILDAIRHGTVQLVRFLDEYVQKRRLRIRYQVHRYAMDGPRCDEDVLWMRNKHLGPKIELLTTPGLRRLVLTEMGRGRRVNISLDFHTFSEDTRDMIRYTLPR